ncbi:MAG: hypothetical protein PHU56_03830 [Candidatus Pacebacteria bacterium]|nr:hypothetical protein [Candidatus Paceibacterota bacterium]
MPAKKTICLSLIFFVLGVFLAPGIVLAINHEYVGCGDQYNASDPSKRVSSGINKTDGKCLSGQERRVCYEGMVPCGKNVAVASNAGEDVHWDETNKVCVGGRQVIVNCQFCHLFVIVDGIMDFIMVDILPPLTVAVLVIGGIMFYFTGARPEFQNRSKTLFKNVVIGLFLIYGSYMIVGIFLIILGAADMNPLKDVFDSTRGIFSITCSVEVP